MHETLLKLFATYIVVGGMPDVVQTYVDTHDIGKVVRLQRNILELYRQDISKYSEGAEKVRIKAIFDSIASQLDDKNRRFILNRIDENGRMNRYENSFMWLSDAGVALPSYNVTEPQAPLQLNEKRNLFKLFMGDTGLLCASCMENIQFELLQGNMDVNMGSILENVSMTGVRLDVLPYSEEMPLNPAMIPANFRNATLKNVDFSGAYLAECDFRNACIGRINFAGADLRGAKIDSKYKELWDLTEEQKNSICWLSE